MTSKPDKWKVELRVTMKKYVLLIAAIVFVAGCGVTDVTINKPAEENKKLNEFIIDYPGMMKNQLFSEVTKAMALVYKSSKSVIELEDKDAGTIVGNGYAKVPSNCKLKMNNRLDLTISYVIVISVKDERVRYRYTPTLEVFHQVERGTSGMFPEEAFQYIENAECFWEAIVPYFKTLTNHMSEIIQNDDDF